MSKIYVAASFSYQDEEKMNQRKKEILEVVERSDILPPLKEVGASCSMTLMSQA